MKPTLREAYQLLHRGIQVFARIEANGKLVDVPYLKDTVKSLSDEIKAVRGSLYADPVWKTWTRLYPGDQAKLNSRPQLAHVIFKEMGFPARAKTESGDKDSTEESAFRGIPLPFLGGYFRLQKLQKLRKTYFLNILKEQQGGVLRPSFNLHTVSTYRSSSSEPNYHNIPVRDPEAGPMIRRAFRARKGNHLVEVDLAGAEVKVAYCYHEDPTMRDYLLDPASDMHRDTASELFFLPVEFLKQHKDWAKKTVRDWAKNRMVFPEFYGSVYFQCAPHLWEAVTDLDREGRLRCVLPTGVTLVDHLKANGVGGLGACDPGLPPMPGTFEHHVSRVEKGFWERRFPVYTQWKNRWVRDYESRGHFDLHTGFRCHGLFKRNQVINYPVQGAAFHVLLYSLVLLQDYLDRHKFRARIVGQIHDSVIADVPPDELQDYLTAVRHIITVTVPKRWPWIIIPLEVEAEVSPLGGTWADKELWVTDDGGEWGRAKKS